MAQALGGSAANGVVVVSLDAVQAALRLALACEGLQVVAALAASAA